MLGLGLGLGLGLELGLGLGLGLVHGWHADRYDYNYANEVHIQWLVLCIFIRKTAIVCHIR